MAAGKVPPLATFRAQGPVTFPYSFTLSDPTDVTPEFSNTPPAEWEREDLLVAARLDMDGIAATRGPDDLVGRSGVRKNNKVEPDAWQPASIELQGRGLTGRLLTGGK